MRYLDLENWPRREHFDLFRIWTYPHFNFCANVNLTKLYPEVKDQGISITIAIVYVLSRAANDIPEFRYRIHGDKVVEHDIVHPSATILIENDLFTFCPMIYTPDFAQFAEDAKMQLNQVKEHPSLEDPENDDQLFMTAIPWVSFTSFMHPIDLDPVDSVPRFAWGKFFQEGDELKMPLNVQAHHALMDGFHMGRYYQKVQEYFDKPEFLIRNP
ncbi:MAG: CatA-like O-acetyltransferase [Anaerolineales bacterium]